MKKWSRGVQTYKRLLKAAQKYWLFFVFGIVGTIILSVTDASLSWMMGPLINKGLIQHDHHFIKFLPFLVVMLFCIRGGASFSSQYFIFRVARSVVRDFRRQVFTKFLKMTATYYDRTSSGHLLSVIIYNVEQVAQASSNALLESLRESSLLIGLIVVMFVSSWRLAAMFFVIAPFLSWVIKTNSTRMRRLSTTVQQSVGEVTHVADEGIQGYKVIRLYGGEDYENGKFLSATKKNLQRELKIVVTNSTGTSIVQLLISIPIAMILTFSMLPSFHVSAGNFASVLASMVMILRPLRRLTMLNSDIQKGIAGAEGIFEILDEPVEKDVGTHKVNRVRGEISFENVKFSYETSKTPVLHDISFHVEPGKVVAIVGRSGSGKTSLISLLPRFYEIQKGVIKIDGININDYPLNDLRKQFALVSQQTTLFNDTIAKNIAYGFSENIPEIKIIEAAEAANAMEFIQHLPDGLHSIVGENGVLLSGGQRQRIAIARALIKNAPILILDEATSALDTHTERQIQQGLELLMKQRTTLVIAHRLSTIENADWIIVMDQGRIIEQGTHHELFEKNNAYAALHRMQFRDGSTMAAQTQAETV